MKIVLIDNTSKQMNTFKSLRHVLYELEKNFYSYNMSTNSYTSILRPCMVKKFDFFDFPSKCSIASTLLVALCIHVPSIFSLHKA